MNNPKTLLQLSGASLEPASLEGGTLILIDIQNEYSDGPLALPYVDKAAAQASASEKYF